MVRHGQRQSTGLVKARRTLTSSTASSPKCQHLYARLPTVQEFVITMPKFEQSLYATYTDDIPTLRGHPKDWEDDVIGAGAFVLYANDSAYFASSQEANLVVKKIQRVLTCCPNG
ncbi:hypothetical protein EVAR_65881_1 [Eumeta japonica]|uniref:Uncharacterized protein n=1 Tax=Eumeta variegata TaxID=151549 RepID=A0A4C1ZGS7_EUMVA|nr:hypothetical protein EVAR_65881_1 [Eumeta japonica]